MYYNNDTIVFFDGRFQKATASGIDPYSQTLHYGYGVFEGIRSYQTGTGPVIFKAREHYQRLIQSCRLMHIPFHYSVDELIALTYELLDRNGLGDAYIRPVVIGDPNMSLSKPPSSRLFIAAWTWDYFGKEPLNLHISPFCRPHPNSLKVEAKTCGYYTNSILATTEAKAKGFDDALLLDHEGYLAEGPGANLFFEKAGKLYTPATGHILPGITRTVILDLCKQMRIPVETGRYRPDVLYNADGAFYCGTGAEVAGIGTVNGRQFQKAWPETLGLQIQEAYHELVRRSSYQTAITII